jgi:hypothetical protein
MQREMADKGPDTVACSMADRAELNGDGSQGEASSLAEKIARRNHSKWEKNGGRCQSMTGPVRH